MKIGNRKYEFGKLACTIIFLVGVGSVVAYYWAIFAGFQPDASVAVAGITEILGGILGYFFYQGKLKASLNDNKLYIDNEGNIKRIKGFRESEENTDEGI